MRRVPLTRRNLLADPWRLVASAVGVGLALMLILLLDGLWQGIQTQATLYEDHTGAQLYVVAPGTQGLFTDSSSVPTAVLGEAQAIPGVEWVAPVRTQYAILDLHGAKVAVAVIGAVPGERGGVWALASGRAPAADDEVVVDQLLADRHHLVVGSTVAVAGAQLRVVGISKGTAAFMLGFMFVTHHATDLALRAPDTTTAILIGTHDPVGVRARLESDGLTVLDHTAIRAAALQLATRIYGAPLKLMVGVGFAAGTLVIALTAYTAIAERRREYGILKAIGATGRHLTGLAVGQTFGVAAAGAIAGGVLFAAGRAAIVWYRPQFLVELTTGSVVRASAALIVMATIAAVIPARRLAHLDPAVAYRGG